MKKTLSNIVLIFVFPCLILGQKSGLSDTIVIKEIVVKASLLSGGLPGYRQILFDSITLNNYSMENLSGILSEKAPLFIKSYGPGGIATVSLRGTPAGHTQVAWNEINLNSPMLGQADLSLIPAGFIDDMCIHNGGAPVYSGSAGPGGIINLETKPDWQKSGNLTVRAGAGSFGRYSGLISARSGGTKFQSVTKIFTRKARNNFTYVNDVISSSPVTERRQNAETTQKSFMQEFYLKGAGSSTSARLWYQDSERNIPAIILANSVGNTESQYDQFFRAMVGHQRYGSGSNADISLALLTDRLNYYNYLASIDSRNKSSTISMKTSLEVFNGTKSRMRFSLNNELNLVNSVNYQGVKKRNVATFTMSARKILGGKHGLMLLIRETLLNTRFIFPDFLAGMDIRLLPDRAAYIKLNLSRSSKLPSMNDLYWDPGGNPELKNENCYSGEIALKLEEQENSLFNYSSEVSLYSSLITDMIQWKPSDTGYWSPVNLATVKTKGLEAFIKLDFTRDNFAIRLTGQYSLTGSQVVNDEGDSETTGKQLIYVPAHILNNNLRISHGSFYYEFTANYVSRRYTVQDNSMYLNGYVINNLAAGYKFPFGNDFLDFNIKIDNILGTEYQVVAYHPMPGRSLMLTLSYYLVL